MILVVNLGLVVSGMTGVVDEDWESYRWEDMVLVGWETIYGIPYSHITTGFCSRNEATKATARVGGAA